MINNVALDIGIGLVLMFLVLSLMGTVINEFIATAMNLRAKTLKSAVSNLLDDKTLHDAFFDHGLIDGPKQMLGKDPSYLSGQTFALAIFGAIDPNNPAPSFKQAEAAINAIQTAGKTESNIKDALVDQLKKADGDIAKLRDGIATYFDASMDRVTGLYKKYQQLITFCVAIVIVVVLNADAINVGTALWRDSSLRAQMVETASTVANNDKANAGNPGGDYANRLKKLDQQIRPLPIGWSASEVKSELSSWPALVAQFGFLSVVFHGAWWTLVKIIGLGITVFAISLGAPFSFDMLSKLMNVRGAGNKPETTATTSIKQVPGPTLTITTQQPAANAGGSTTQT
jgi:hypothetical protein